MDEDVRRELDRLNQDVRDVRTEIINLDNHGSRGVLQLQGQATELIKDVADLRMGIEVHKKEHEQEKQDRTTGRRWLIGISIAAVVGIGGMFVTILRMLMEAHL